MSIRPVVLRFYEEVFNQGRPEAVDELLAPGGVIHGAGISERSVRDPEEMKAQVALLRAAFPDLHVEVLDLVCERDRAAMRCRATGTHLGEALGIPPSGRRVEIEGVSFGRWRDGLLVEGWNSFDLLSLYRQLGLLRLLAGAPPSGPLPVPDETGSP